jgi:alkanesulfonate monooxygenase SsuD/methylene tetrahydromethanopterin reductase-like flavin-dependent oxidoreductase (luciferase family)
MRFGIDIAPFGELADPALLARLAAEAEATGWDGVFLWDHLQGEAGWDTPIADIWVALTAVAVATRRVRLGPMVLALPRRRPWLVARAAATLDRLSGGRLILGVGLGFPPEAEFGAFGEDPSLASRASRLDEGLAILAGLWGDERFSFEGSVYRVRDVTLRPTPVQRPRIPIWVATTWPRTSGIPRAARWDGIAPLKLTAEAMPDPFLPDEIEELTAAVAAHRDPAALGPGAPPYDVVVWGETGADPDADARRIRELEGAGATWWCEPINGWRGSPDALLERIGLGPPRPGPAGP